MSSPSDKPPKPDNRVPDPELNPMSNPVLARNMGRWAEVYFTSPPEKREEAVQLLLRELQNEQPQNSSPATTAPEAAPAPPEPKPATAAADMTPCPACLHRNLPQQRFCGLCGFPLHSESQNATESPVAISTHPVEPSSPPIERTEEGWEWLREKNLAALHTPDEQPTNHWKYAVGALALIGGGVLVYFLLSQPHTDTHTQPAATAAVQKAPATPQPTPAPADANPPLPPPGQSTATSDKTDKSADDGEESPAKSPASAADASTDSGANTDVDDGHRELVEGRRYLDGDGVPKNTAIASTWLWKAVAKQNAEAVLLLSDLYVRGDGVPQSCDQARILLTAAARRGYAGASEKLARLKQAPCP